MRQKFKITLKSHLSQLDGFLFGTGGGIVGIWYFINKHGTDRVSLYFIFIGMGFLFSVLVLPAIVIHIQYYLINRKTIFQIDEGRHLVVYEGFNTNMEFHFDDIRLIEHFMTGLQINKKMHIMAWTSYHYAKITLLDDQIIYVTSLLADEFNLPIENTKVQIHEVVFPNIKR